MNIGVGFGGMGLGSFGGFAPTPEQIQERLKASGIVGYTPPAPIVAPAPTTAASKEVSVRPVPAPKVVPVPAVAPTGSIQKSQVPTGRGPVADDYDYGSRPTPTTPKPVPVMPVAPERIPTSTAPTPVAPVFSAPISDFPEGRGVADGPTTPTSAAPVPVTPAPIPSTADPVIVADALKNVRAMTKNMTPEQLREVSTYAPELAEQLREPITPKSAIQSYKDTLLGAADKNVYDVIGDVDEVDDFYDKAFRGSVLEPLETDKKAITARDTTDGGARGSQYLSGKRGDVFAFTPDEYISEVGAPEYLKGLKRGVGTDKDVIRSAYSSIANADGAGTAAALSNYYGFDVTLSGSAPDIENFGGNYEEHTNASQEQISEFQSLIKPVLAETIPYLQATEGLSYQDALLEAYKRDPMIQAMYAKYGVQPIRQTKDGSTYLYDPMTFGEIRTKEVKDSSVKDALKVVAMVGLSAFGGGALAGTAAFGGGTSAAGSALAYGTTSAGITAATGGDTNDIIKSFALGGVGGFAKGLNANAAGLADKARQGAFTLGAAAPDPALIEAANAAAKTADSFNKVVQGAKFVDAAVDGDIAGAAVSAFGPKFTKIAMDKVGLDKDFLSDYNINQDDVVAGLVKTQTEIAKGVDFGDAIARGFGEYIMEGGALGPNNVKTPEFIKMIGDTIKEVGSKFDDVLLQPIKGFGEGFIEAVGDVAEPVIDVARDIGSAVDDEVVQPVREVLKDVDDEVIQPVKEGIEDIYESVDLPDVDVNLPDVDVNLPDVNLPDVNLPEAELPDTTTPPFFPPLMPRFRQVISEVPEGQEITPYDFGDDPLLAFLADNLRKNQEGMAGGGAVRSSYGNLDELLRIVGGK